MGAGLDAASRARLRRGGVKPIEPQRALDLLDASLACDRPLLLPVELDVAALRALAEEQALPRMLRSLAPARSARPRPPRGALRTRLLEATGAEREQIALDAALAHTAAVLGHDSPADLRPGQAFKELGFDSLMAVELRNRLSAEIGVALASTLVFDHPTPEAVAACLLDAVAPARQEALGDGPEGERANVEAQDEDVLVADTAEEVLRLIDRELDTTEELVGSTDSGSQHG
jgi:acyl carrier protein